MTTWIVQNLQSDDPAVGIELLALKELDRDAAEGAWASYAELRSHLVGDLFVLVRTNVEAHRVFVGSLFGRLAAGTLGEGSSAGTLEAVAQVMNFAASVHAFQEHSEVRAGRQGGDDLRRQIHQIFRNAYESMPDLFLVRRLRDVFVHSGFDGLVATRLATQFLAPGVSGPVDMQLRVVLLAEPLKGHDKMNTTLREHLATFGEEVDILALMERALDCLGTVHNQIVPMYRPRLMQRAVEWAQMMAVLHGSGVDPATCFLLRQENAAPFDPTRQFSLTPITGDHSDFALQIAAQIYNIPA